MNLLLSCRPKKKKEEKDYNINQFDKYRQSKNSLYNTVESLDEFISKEIIPSITKNTQLGKITIELREKPKEFKSELYRKLKEKGYSVELVGFGGSNYSDSVINYDNEFVTISW
jgi:hypothetical protein